MKSNLVDIEVSVYHRTEKAALVSLDGDREKAVWVPLAQCEIEPKGKHHVLTCETWLATEKGLV